MNSEPLIIKANCKGNEQCFFEGQDMFLDITITNNNENEIGFPLEYVQQTGPIVRLINIRNQLDNYLPSNPASWELQSKFIKIKPRDSVNIEWVIATSELLQFGSNSVDILAEISVNVGIEMDNKIIPFVGTDTLRIVSK